MKTQPTTLAIGVGVLFGAVFLLNEPVFAADSGGQWTAKPVAVMVVSPEGGKDNRNFCWKTGVTVSAVLTPPAGKIISIDQNESKVTSFTDDKGTDLMAGPVSDDPFNKPGLSYQSPQGDAPQPSALVDLRAPSQPAKGATMFTISGQVSAETGSNFKEVTVADAALTPDTKFNVGANLVKISEAGVKTNDWDKKVVFSVTLSCAQSLDFISKIQFFDPQGKEIESHRSMWGGGFLGYMAQYDLAQKVDHAKIVVGYWTDLKSVTVPFTVKTGVGL